MTVVSISIPCRKEEIEKIEKEIKELLAEDNIDARIERKANTRFAKDDRIVLRVNTFSYVFNENIKTFRYIKENYKDVKVRLHTEQRGGGWSNTGHAAVTTLMDGRKPMAVATGHYCNGTHAHYWISEGFTILTDYWMRRTPRWRGEIYWEKVSFNNGYISEQVAKIEANSRNNITLKNVKRPLKRNVKKLIPAIKTAMEKCICYHCRSEHAWEVEQ